MALSIGALIFPRFELLDLFGPLQMFGMLKDDFSIHLVAESVGPVTSNQGPVVLADQAIGAAEGYDIILIPGGLGTRAEVGNEALVTWIAHASREADHVLSVCTGSALLAKAGVLDRKRATTNKLAFDWVVKQGPHVEWQRQARWVEDGKYITSSGVSSGMDMTLAALATMLGEPKAREVAKWCEYIWNDDPAHDPFVGIG